MDTTTVNKPMIALPFRPITKPEHSSIRWTHHYCRLPVKSKRSQQIRRRFCRHHHHRRIKATVFQTVHRGILVLSVTMCPVGQQVQRLLLDRFAYLGWIGQQRRYQYFFETMSKGADLAFCKIIPFPTISIGSCGTCRQNPLLRP
jgi:hypothetical protein